MPTSLNLALLRRSVLACPFLEHGRVIVPDRLNEVSDLLRVRVGMVSVEDGVVPVAAAVKRSCQIELHVQVARGRALTV